MYDIAVDVLRRRVLLTMTGHFGTGDVEPFQVALVSAANMAKAGGTSFDLLVDLTESGVLPKVLTSDTATFLTHFVAIGLRRSANITTSALMKMQVQRISASDRFRFFTSREEAIAWLESSD